MSFSVRRISDEQRRRRFPWHRTAILLLTIAQPIVGWYQRWKRRKKAEEEQEHRTMFLKRVLLVLLAVFCALVLLAGTVKALIAVNVIKLDSIISVAGADLPKDEHGFVNLVLMGQGDEGHDGIDLTDTIIIASIDPLHTHSATLLSIPRDTYFLATEKMGAGRVNSLYRDYKNYLQRQGNMTTEQASLEALEEVGQEIGRKFGMTIHRIVKVDFIAFVEAVDALDGIDIVVPENILDPEYPNENYGYETFAINAGPQHLDGATALKYVRSRHTTSDFSRSARQQQVISALAEKAKTDNRATDPAFLTRMLKTYTENVETTMSIREMIGLAKLGEDIDRSRIFTMQLSDRNGLYGGFVEPGGFLYTPPRELFQGAAVLLPVSLPEFPVTWKQPQTLMKLLLGMRELYLANPMINILNSGARSGSARLLASELIRYGFTVNDVANAELPSDLTESVIATNIPEQENLAQAFGQIFRIPKGPFPTDLPVEQRNDLTIILGEDYRYMPLQDLLPSAQ